MPPEQQPNHPLWIKIILIIPGILLILGGLLLFSYYSMKSPELAQEQELYSPSTSSGQFSGTENWQTYRNEEYGFEIKYPPKWWLDYQIIRNSVSESTLAVGNGVNPNLKCDVWFYFDGSDPNKGNRYTDENERRNCDLTLNAVISTFKYEGPIPADWKTYRNEEYRFEFKYPEDGHINGDENKIWITNYTAIPDRQFMNPGEYYLEFYLPRKNSCVDYIINSSKKEMGDAIIYIGNPNLEINEYGGEVFALCSERFGQYFYMQVVENNIDGPIANQILSTFKFIEPKNIYAIKTGAHVVVYRKDEVLFEYDEVDEKYKSGNHWIDLPHNMAPSRDSQKIAYIDKDGLKIFEINKKSHNLLIPHPITNETSYRHEYYEPSWSADGKYILFTQALYEGNSQYVIDVQTKKYAADINYQPSSKVHWSPTNAVLVWGESREYGDYGLWVADFNNTSEISSIKPKNIAEIFNQGKANFHSTYFDETGNLIFTYSPEGTPWWPPKFKATANLDGSGFRIIEEVKITE